MKYIVKVVTGSLTPSIIPIEFASLADANEYINIEIPEAVGVYIVRVEE